MWDSVSSHLKEWYKQTRFCTPDDDIDDIWQLLYPEHFANVLLIRHHKHRNEKEISKISRIMRGGLMQYENFSQVHDEKFETHEISDIFNQIQNKDGTYEKPKLILINGAPGMGKTTLCKEIAYCWAKGSLLSDNSLVLLLYLRDPKLQKIYDINDLIHYFYNFKPSAAGLSEQCAETLMKRNNNDITIILDGYDEFYSTDENLLVHSILKNEILSQCTVVVTSRPVASEKLQKISDITVEVLGFTEDSKKAYIEQELPIEMKQQLTTFFSDNPSINSACYVPLMLTILVCTFKQFSDHELPKSETELYEKFVGLSITRYLKKLSRNLPSQQLDDSDLPEPTLSLQTLPKIHQQYVANLSKFAFEAIKLQKNVFTKEDVESICSNFALAFKNYHGLGLLNFVQFTNYKYKIEKHVYYNFVHLSIQEYLAAHYANLLNASEQFSLIKKTFFLNSYMHTWIMFIQINKSRMHKFQEMLNYIHVSESCDDSECNILSVLKNLNLFEDVSGLKSITISNVTGTFQVLCFKDNMTNLREQNVLCTSYDGFLFFEQLFNPVVKFDWIKLYISLCRIDNGVNQLIEIYLIDKNTHETAYHDVVAELQHNRNLAVMLVNSTTLLAYRAKSFQICDALAMNESLTALLLRDCYITDETANVISPFLIKCKSFKIISITHCWKQGCEASLTTLKAFSTINTLTHIDLRNNDMTEKVAVNLANAIRANIFLEVLLLGNNNFQSSSAIIFKALQNISFLKLLDVSNNNMTGKVVYDLADVIANNTSLEGLCLGGNNLQSSVGVILQALKGVSNVKVLDLDDNNMSEEVASDLADVIKNNVQLEELHLFNNKLQSSCTVILQALKRNSNLKKLNLSDNNMTGKVVYDLADVIANNTSLEWLYLGGNNLQSSAGVILQALKGDSNVKVLDLNDNNMSEEVASDLADVIKNNAQLEELRLFNNKLQSSCTVILQALKRNSNLKTLNLNGNNMTGKVVYDLADVIANNTSLEGLYLGSNNLQSSAGVILQTLKGVSNVKFLDLSDNSMSEEVASDLADVIKNNVQLEELRLFNNKLQSSCTVILKALKRNSNLKTLNLNDNMTGKVVYDLADVIANNTSLEGLYLRGNNLQSSAGVILQTLKGVSNVKFLDLSDNSMSEEVASDLADVIKNNVQLEELRLFNNKLQSSCTVILQALKRNSNLKTLNLNDNNMTGKVVYDLADVIANNTSLEGLYLRGNNLQSSAGVILQALKGVSNVKVLDLSDNNMSEEIASDLADVIKNNVQLEELHLFNNELQSCCTVILQALKRNSNLKTLNLNDNNMTGKVVYDLADVIANNTSLEGLYLRGNNLQSSAGVILQALKGVSNVKVLDLSDNNMSEEVASDLADVIKNNVQLEELHLFNNELQSCCTVILQALKSNSNLKKLSLNDNNMTGKVVYDLADVIANNTSLEVLCLGGNNLQSSVGVILQVLKGVSNVKVLDLSDNSMSEEVASDLADVIKNNVQLEELCLFNNELQSCCTVILQALKRNSNLKTLNLNDNNMTGKVVYDLADVIANNTSLEVLCLGGNNLQPSAGVILQALKGVSNVKVLDLSDNNMSEEVVRDLADVIKNNVQLEELCLFNNELQSCCTVILQALKRNSNLKTLNLNDNNMTGKVVYDLADVIANNTSLEGLYLRGNNLQSSAGVILQGVSNVKFLDLSDNNMSEEVASDLADVIKNNVQLEELCLFNNKLQSSCTVILQALKRNSNLKTLNLNDNNMTGKVVYDLADVIANNTSLEVLCLGGNNLQSSASVILQALKGVSNVKVLDLSDNNMSEEVASDLADVIKNNVRLEELHLFNNELQSCCIVILQALKRNSNLKTLNLNDNNMTGKVVYDLADVIANNTSLEGLYLRGNNLQSSAGVILQALKGVSNVKVLDLSDNNMSEEVASDLADVIKNNVQLEELCFFNNKLQSSCTVILQALKRNSNLKTLNLNDNNMTGKVVYDLADVIANNTSLEVLCLRGNNLQSSAGVILQALKGVSNVKILDLSDNNMSKEVVRDLADVIKNNVQLEELCLFNELQSCCTVISQALKRNSNLKKLNLNDNNMTGKVVYDLADVIANNTSLEVLCLGGNNLQSSVGVIFQALKGVSNVKVLDLDDNSMSEEVASDLADVIKNNVQLEELRLCNNKLQSSCTVILQALKRNSNLKKLSLNDNNMTGKVVYDLADVIANNTSLEGLYLGGNNLQSSVGVILQALKGVSNVKFLDLDDNMSEEVASDLVDVIKNNVQLEELRLCNNKLQSSCTVILQALKRNSNLKTLNLNGNNMTGKVVYDLADVIANNTSLEGLYLRGNNLQSSVGVILQALKGVSNVKFLDLDDNNMSEEVASDLADVIKNNVQLEELRLCNNKSQSSCTVILQALKRNSNLKTLNLNGNNMTGKVVYDLADVIANNTSLEGLYLRGNNLQSSVGVILQALKGVSNVKFLDLDDNNMSEEVASDLADVIKNNVQLTLV